MNIRLTSTFCLTAGLLAATTTVHADEQWRASAATAADGAVKFLLKAQHEDGSFGTRPHPGVTALCVKALADSGSAQRNDVREAVEKGLDNLRTFARKNGSVQSERHPVPVYTTAVALLAFDAGGRKKDEDVIRAGRDYLLGAQRVGKGPDGEDQPGGFGYGPDSRPDASNTHWAMEALHATREFAREPLSTAPDRDAKKAEAAFEGAIRFLEACQNDTKGDDNYGGVSYLPQDWKPSGLKQRLATLAKGKPDPNYGAMTYGAMKTMIYADLDRDDPRVKSMLNWVRHHFTFEENPGRGMNSYYYYMITSSRAFDVLGIPEIRDGKGTLRKWREELAGALVKRQNQDGSWLNKVGRHWESDPHLVTAYALLALELALGEEVPAETGPEE